MTRHPQAHYQPIRMAVPVSRQPVDKWEHDIGLVLGAIAFLLLLAILGPIAERW